MTEKAVEEILSFWFGSEIEDKIAVDKKSGIWWGKNEKVDRDIRQRFGDLHDLIGTGNLDHWKQGTRSRLALIILADQFSRNIYRNSPRSFEHDALALQLALDGIDKSLDRGLRRIERVFFYIPLEHSESIDNQNKSVELYRQLVKEAPATDKEIFKNYVDYAVRHQEIIERFGRFPHRNAVLGRISTEEEIRFLEQPGSSF